MAIMKSIVAGKFRGNAGSFRFAQSAGRDVVSERVYTNKSKGYGASYAQRVQRCKIMNLANAYAALKPLLNKAFEGRKSNQSAYNAFAAANLGTSNIHLSKFAAEIGAFSSVGLTISKGSLPAISSAGAGTDEVQFFVGVGNDIDFETATVAQISLALVANNSFLKIGDQITLVRTLGEYIHNYEGSDDHEYNESVEILEFTLDANDTRVAINDPYLSKIFNDTDIVWDRSRIVLSGVCGCAVIISRKANARLLVSTQKMILGDTRIMGYEKYTSDANLEAAAASYGYQDQALLDPGSEAQPNA